MKNVFTYLILSYICLLISGCKKPTWSLPVLPKLGNVVTVENNQSYTKVSVEILEGSNTKNTEFGFCYSNQPLPNIEDQKVIATPNKKSLSASLSWSGTQDLYIRAYAKNNLGVSYSENILKLSWPATSANIPQISLISLDSVSFYFADCQAMITSDGDLPIVQRGFFVSTNTNPLATNSMVFVNSSSTLTFSNRNTGLNENTTYYVRAFVTNTYQTSISAEILSFQTENFYNIGEIGPAGGKVFYSSLDGTTSWHFLEAAPTDLSSSFSWSNDITSFSGLSTSIGSGLSNTELIVLNQGASGNYSALKAQQYAYGGFTDWFLPSRDELSEMYQNLYLNSGNGLATNSEYWSSSQDANYLQNAWIVKMSNSSNIYSMGKLQNKKVRVIRQF